MNNWQNNIKILYTILNTLSVTDSKGEAFGIETGFDRWFRLTHRVHRGDRQLFLIGNGASSSMASHFATDIAKNGGLRAQVFSDSSMLTAVSNDIAFTEVFAEPLRWYMKKEDMLVAISSSGQSANILRAVDVAKEKAGIVVTLSGMAENNSLRKSGDLNFYAAAKTYGHVETAHAAILHHWMDLMEVRPGD